MKYIHAPEDKLPLAPETVVSIMVSSDFLEMPELVQECLLFLKKMISEVVQVRKTEYLHWTLDLIV